MAQTLTQRQELFVDEYLRNGCDAANAARVAGFSESTSRAATANILSSPSVRGEIDRRLEDLRHRAQVKLGAHLDEVIDSMLELGLNP